ncbi:hypothetical protein [Photobacterium leiognathi]|uniref:hypothetical protein n=1 Tax=Photobacterium leiognathi TaxID=553611 RepID=UPI002981483F|nr:hypothetical protein [Photobacterium leiognathi]
MRNFPIAGDAVLVRSGNRSGQFGVLMGKKKRVAQDEYEVAFNAGRGVVSERNGFLYASCGTSFLSHQDLQASTEKVTMTFRRGVQFGGSVKRSCKLWYYDAEASDQTFQSVELNTALDTHNFHDKCQSAIERLDAQALQLIKLTETIARVHRGAFTLFDQHCPYNNFTRDCVGVDIIKFYRDFKKMKFVVHQESVSGYKVVGVNGFRSFRSEEAFRLFIAAYNLVVKQVEPDPLSDCVKAFDVEPNCEIDAWMPVVYTPKPISDAQRSVMLRGRLKRLSRQMAGKFDGELNSEWERLKQELDLLSV